MNSNRLMVEYIKSEARKHGACDLVDKVLGWKTLSDAMKSPQGIEFMEKNSGKEWMKRLLRDYKAHLRRFCIHVDEGQVVARNVPYEAIVGNTKADITCSGTDTPYTIMVMDGGSVTLQAEEYAVIRVYNLGGEVTITNDGTAKILTTCQKDN